MANAKREILGIESSNLEQFADRVKQLREQLQAGAITKAEFDKAFQSSQQQILGIDTDPIDKFKERLAELRKALDKGLITKEQFKTAAIDALPDRVKSIIDETRTPLEKYKADMAELNKLKGAGLLDNETYRRKSEKLKTERDQSTTTANQPTTFGSFSASALIDSGRDAGASSAQARMAELSKRQNKLTEDQTTELRELRKQFSQFTAGFTAR